MSRWRRKKDETPGDELVEAAEGPVEDTEDEARSSTAEDPSAIAEERAPDEEPDPSMGDEPDAIAEEAATDDSDVAEEEERRAQKRHRPKHRMRTARRDRLLAALQARRAKDLEAEEAGDEDAS
ncbi:MAG: hypothetical protein QOH90_1833, partial [Actinomycetota bacterium]|nr:hypothetical protein [Actinomycetota bacterium]